MLKLHIPTKNNVLCCVSVTCTEEGSVTTIEAQIVSSPREGRVVKVDGGTCACPLCQLNLNIKHTVSCTANIHRHYSVMSIFVQKCDQM